MTEYTPSKNVLITVFFNLFSLTQCLSYSNKIKYFLLHFMFYVTILNYSKIP